MKKNIIVGLFILPLFASAQFTKTGGLLAKSLEIIQGTLIPIAFTLAVLFFILGVAKFVWQVGEKKAEGRKIMIWGIAGLFVMSSVWGIIRFINENLGLNSSATVKVPTIGGGGTKGNTNGDGDCTYIEGFGSNCN